MEQTKNYFDNVKIKLEEDYDISNIDVIKIFNKVIDTFTEDKSENINSFLECSNGKKYINNNILNKCLKELSTKFIKQLNKDYILNKYILYTYVLLCLVSNNKLEKEIIVYRGISRLPVEKTNDKEIKNDLVQIIDYINKYEINYNDFNEFDIKVKEVSNKIETEDEDFKKDLDSVRKLNKYDDKSSFEIPLSNFDMPISDNFVLINIDPESFYYFFIENNNLEKLEIIKKIKEKNKIDNKKIFLDLYDLRNKLIRLNYDLYSLYSERNLDFIKELVKNKGNYTTKRFWSSSLSEEIAKEFVKNECCLLEIVLPKNAKALYIGGFEDKEEEILISPFSNFQFISCDIYKQEIEEIQIMNGVELIKKKNINIKKIKLKYNDNNFEINWNLFYRILKMINKPDLYYNYEIVKEIYEKLT